MSEPEKVVGIHGGHVAIRGEPQQDLIAVLMNALERAKTGELQSFIGTGFVSNGNRFSICGGLQVDVYAMLGAIAWLEHEYVARVNGNID